MSSLPKAPACKGGARMTNSGRPASEALLPMAACCEDNRGAFHVWKEAFTSLAGQNLKPGSLADWCWTGELDEIPGVFLPRILLMGQGMSASGSQSSLMPSTVSLIVSSRIFPEKQQETSAGEGRPAEGTFTTDGGSATRWQRAKPTWDSQPHMEARAESRSPLCAKP